SEIECPCVRGTWLSCRRLGIGCCRDHGCARQGQGPHGARRLQSAAPFRSCVWNGPDVFHALDGRRGALVTGRPPHAALARGQTGGTDGALPPASLGGVPGELTHSNVVRFTFPTFLAANNVRGATTPPAIRQPDFRT